MLFVTRTNCNGDAPAEEAAPIGGMRNGGGSSIGHPGASMAMIGGSVAFAHCLLLTFFHITAIQGGRSRDAVSFAPDVNDDIGLGYHYRRVH